MHCGTDAEALWPSSHLQKDAPSFLGLISATMSLMASQYFDTSDEFGGSFNKCDISISEIFQHLEFVELFEQRFDRHLLEMVQIRFSSCKKKIGPEGLEVPFHHSHD